MSVVGFDIGTASCVIAVAQKGGIDVIMNEVSSRQTATMAAFGDKERYLGESAATQYIRNIKNTVPNVKRLLGRKFSEPEVQEELKLCPFKAVQLPDDNIGIEVMYAGEKRVFTPVTITAMILEKLKEITEKATEKPCCDVVIGVPGWWIDRQRRAMLDASRIAGLNCLRTFNENTASALGYGIYKSNQFSDTEPTRAMFYDMGASQTSCTIVEFFKGKLKVVSAAYDRNLGGRNFDFALCEHFLKEFQEKYKLDLRSNQKALIRLQLACEKLKKMLNTVPEAPISVESIMNDVDVKGMMKRSEFEALIQPLLERALGPVKKVLEETGIKPEQLSAVEITGGGTRLIAVQNKLTEFLKRDIGKTLNFEESVARGCALQCAMLSPVFKVREFSVIDINLYPIKLIWKSPDQTNVDESKDSAEIFSKNNPVPCPKMITLYRSGTLELIVQYADLSLLPPGTDPFIAKFVISNISTASGEPAKLRIKIKLDINGIVTVDSVEQTETLEEPETPSTPSQTTESPATPQQQQQQQQTETKTEEATPMQDAVPTTPPPSTPTQETEEKKKKKVKHTNLSVQEITTSIPAKTLQELIEEEARMGASDRLFIETAEKKNAVESYVYDMRNKLSDSLQEFSSEKERETLSKALEDAESWLYGEGEEATKSVYVKKLEDLKALGDPIVRRKNEYDNRYDALNNLKRTIDQYKLLATSADPKYEHISQEDRNKVTSECDNAAKWVTEQMMKQDKLSKHANPVITVAELNKKQQDLNRTASAIMNKPKPVEKPKEPEKKPEEAKPAEQKKTSTEEQAKPEGQKENGQSADGNMDLD